MNLTVLKSTGGIEYLLKTVVGGDMKIEPGRLIDYYAAGGTPPGVWWGRGAEGAGIEGEVSVQGADRLFKNFVHPVTGEKMGIRPRKVKGKATVAGFDLTFTIPKSVSVLWGLGDDKLRDAIWKAHQRAIDQSLVWLEDEVLRTRSGQGGVVTDLVEGAITARFDHFDSRDGDPHLHTHAVVSNRVRRVRDGHWLTVDSLTLYKGTVAASELHSNLILDELTRSVGLVFDEPNGQVTSRAVVMDVKGVDPHLIDHFSNRKWAIEARIDELVQAHIKDTGSAPSRLKRAQFHSKAWRETRMPKEKQTKPFAQLRATWRARAAEQGTDWSKMSEQVIRWDEALTVDPLNRGEQVDEQIANMVFPTSPSAEGESVDPELAEMAAKAVKLTQRTRATWSRMNVRAEVERLTRGVRSVSVQARQQWVDQITDVAMGMCVQLSQRRYSPPAIQDDIRLWHSGHSVFEQESARLYSSASIMSAEQLIIEAHDSLFTHRTIEVGGARELIEQVDARMKVEGRSSYLLGEDQVAAAANVLSDGRRLSVIVGPAGTGKTSTMNRLTQAWGMLNGEGKVIGLATSAQAAAVLGDDLGATATTIAKWKYETTEGRLNRERIISELKAMALLSTRPWSLRKIQRAIIKQQSVIDNFTMKPGQLIIVDEASMSGTFDLADLVVQAREVGAKIVLVGDPAQLDAPAAGGVMGYLTKYGQTSDLTSIHRFHHQWEATASLLLRDGDEAVIDVYDEHGRFRVGPDEDILEGAYQGVLEDLREGKSAILITATNHVVKDLNERFMIERRAAGEVDDARTVGLRDGLNTGVGDVILSRKVDRKLRDGSQDFIRNGTLLTVTEIKKNYVIAKRHDNDALIELPTTFLNTQCELGYAITAHRAQGATVDRGHVAIPTSVDLPRELLYVAMTRGRESNLAWIGEELIPGESLAGDGLVHHDDLPTWRERITGMIKHQGAEKTATETQISEHARLHSLDRLKAEYTHLYELAQGPITDQSIMHVHQVMTERFDVDVNDLNVDHEDQGSWRALAQALGRLNDQGHDVAQILDQAVTWRGFGDARDKYAIITWRIRTIFGHEDQPPLDIEQLSKQDPDLADAIKQNLALTAQSQAHTLTSLNPESPWVKILAGQLKTVPAAQRQDLIDQVALYRATYRITGKHPLGPAPALLRHEQRDLWQHLNEQLQALKPTDDQTQHMNEAGLVVNPQAQPSTHLGP